MLYCRVLIFLFIFRICQANIPQTFHVFHFEDPNYSQEEVYPLQSWRECHPEWKFKIWTDSDSLLPPFPQAQICQLESLSSFNDKQKDELKRTILNKEGGVWIHPDLICCKSMGQWASFQDFFISKDKTSILGSEAGHPLLSAEESNLPERVILSESFIFPDQTFTTKLAASPLKGVCFWKFKNHSPLNQEFKKIQSRKQAIQGGETRLFKIFSKFKRMGLISLLITILNGILLVLCFPYAYQEIGRYCTSSVHGRVNQFFSSSITKYSLSCILISALVFFGAKSLNKANRWETVNLYEIQKPMNNQVLTKEDSELLHTYNDLYSKHYPSLAHLGDEVQIPHVIHIIWGGENPFPQESIDNIASWIRFHPAWKFKFWTDDPNRLVPIEGMEKHLFSTLSCRHIEKYLLLAENWGEKSDLLRYEILFQEGGVYVDHDVECFRPFDSLHSHFDFYASLEPLHQSPLRNSHVILTNCLIGAKPAHPILENTLHEIANRWDYYSALFPDQDKQSVLLKTLGRTFDSFNYSFNKASKDKTFILPSLFMFPDHFSSEIVEAFKSKNLIFGNHQWTNSWLKDFSELSRAELATRFSTEVCLASNQCKRILEVNIALFMGLSTFLGFSLFRLRKIRKTKELFY